MFSDLEKKVFDLQRKHIQEVSELNTTIDE
jgi:hypothetical protein